LPLFTADDTNMYKFQNTECEGTQDVKTMNTTKSCLSHCSLLYYDTAEWSTFGTNEERANLFLQKAGNQLPDYVLP